LRLEILIISVFFISCNKTSSNTSEISFQDGNGVTDLEGNFYPSVILGNGQEWTTLNLKTSTFTNGEPITNAMSEVSWTNTNSGAWCYYNNDDSNNDVYGKLYNFHALLSQPYRIIYSKSY